MMFYETVAVNCVRYASTMESILVMGIDWANLKAVADLSRTRISVPMLKRLRVIENMLIKESVANAKRK